MLVTTAFCPKDVDQALRQAQWLHELGGAKGHDLLLVADTACPLTQVNEICKAYEASYDSVGLLPFVDHYRSWPRSPNDCFATAARHIMRTRPQPWFWCEPDCVFLVPNALDKLWAEYQTAGKPFLGDFVSAETAGINVIDHCSGNMIVPADLFTHAGLLLIADDIAFDVAAASQIVPQMHKSKLILHRWKAPPFESWEQVQQRIFDIKPKTVLFHANKTGELIELLRTKRNEGEATLHIQNQRMSNAVPKFNPDSTADIFIKTYPPDWPWFTYCHTSCLKFATGFRRIYVVAGAPNHEGMQLRKPVGTGPDWIETPTEIDFTMEYGMAEPSADGYLIQQVVKLYADQYTDADFILFMDSDCIFTVPVTPKTYFTDGKVNWMITPYTKTDTPWQPMIEKFLGRPVEWETMRRHPQMIPRWLLQAMREFCEKQHNMPLDKYVMSQPYREFSEFNALGAFAYYFHPDKFNWINTERVPAEQWPRLTVLQKYSHDGLTPAIETEFEAILKSPASAFVSPAPNGTPETKATQSLAVSSSAAHVLTLPDDWNKASGRLERVWDEVPWADKASSLAEIGRLSSRLKEFCTGPVRTRQVRDALRESGVIK